ncbi:PssD/Cps14F family polysaccharide biosynthesis glycosyltransferase [Vibrio cyclitrophicus]
MQRKNCTKRSAKPAFIIVYGQGGHAAQANRFMNQVHTQLNKLEILSLSDVNKKPGWSDFHYVVPEVRHKYSNSFLFTIRSLSSLILMLRSISNKHKVSTLLSTGPGVSVVAAIYFKLCGVKIVHIETWSRFETKSFTGRFMYFLADKFYYQNISLAKKYSRGTFSGCL